MKKKTLTGLISGLICCSLVGVGFAAWVVTGDATGEVTGGNITAEGIQDKALVIENLTISDGTVDFGAATNSVKLDNIWLTNESVATTDDLTATVKFTVKNYEQMEGEPEFVFEAVNKKSDYDAAVAANVITAQPKIEPTNNGSGSYNVKITFAWGDAFKDPTDGKVKNPYVFYNLHTADETVADTYGTVGYGMTYKAHALEYMKTVAGLDKVTFKLTINAKAKTNTQQPA